MLLVGTILDSHSYSVCSACNGLWYDPSYLQLSLDTNQTIRLITMPQLVRFSVSTRCSILRLCAALDLAEEVKNAAVAAPVAIITAGEFASYLASGFSFFV